MAAGAGCGDGRVSAGAFSRQHALGVLAELVAAAEGPVAIDGPDAAGKTTLADELAARLLAAGCGASRLSVDSFLRPEADRYRRGRTSAEGYYRDAFDYPALRDAVGAAAGEPLLVDGVFLLRPELAALWRLTIFIAVAPDEALRRGVARDGERLGGTAAASELYLTRYLAAQQLYEAEAQPRDRADVVVDNDDPLRPLLLVRRSPFAAG